MTNSISCGIPFFETAMAQEKPLYGADMGEYRKKRAIGIKRQHHGNYGKISTGIQRAAQKRNFSIFRLRGILASLDSIAVYGYLNGEAASKLVRAKGYVRDALIAETGK